MLERSLRPFLRPAALSRYADYRPSESVSPEVDRNATTRVSIEPNSTVLLGIVGTEAARSAIVRLPDGTVERVERGARLGESAVVGVDADAITLERGPHLRRIPLL